MAASRSPLVGRPERVLESLRAILMVGRWLGLLLVPGLAVRGQDWLPASVPAGLGVSLLGLGLAILLVWGGGWLLAHLHFARELKLGAEAVWISSQRRFGRAFFPIAWEEAGGGEGTRVAYARVRRLFRVPLRGASPPMDSLGLWYLGEDGVAREMWWYLDPDEVDGLVAWLVEHTGLEVVEPRPLDQRLASEEVGLEEEQG